jgi:hypothetical protein
MDQHIIEVGMVEASARPWFVVALTNDDHQQVLLRLKREELIRLATEIKVALDIYR